MLLTRILAVFFFVVSIGLGAFLVHRIKFKIDEDRRIERTEQQVINRLKMIRDAQVAYLAVNRKYTGSWDTLINFIDTGHIYLTQRTEQVIMKDYGNDEIIITIDTIGSVAVFDSVFVVREPMMALTSGTLREINASPGEVVNRGDVVAVIQNDRGRAVRLRAPVTAKVETVYASPGDALTASDGIVQLSYNRIGDIKNLPNIPGSRRNAQFELFAGKTTKGNVVVDIFEALDTDPINPARRKNNMERALRVGSRTDVSVSGNWE